MRIARPIALAVILGVLLAAPVADARLVSTYKFSVLLGVLDIGGGSNQTKAPNVTLMTGRANASGERTGLYGVVNAVDLHVTSAAKIEVINTKDQAGAIARAISGECSGNDCAVEKTFSEASASLSSNGTMLFYADGAPLRHAENAPFALSTIVQPPRDLGGQGLKNLTIEKALLLVGDAVALSAQPINTTSGLYAYMPGNESSLTIQGAAGAETYSGPQYLFRFYGTPQVEAHASGILVPFMGEAQATFKPSGQSDLSNHFRPEKINDVLHALGSNQTVVNKGVADNIRSFSPILNGVIFGFGQLAPIVNNKAHDAVNLTLIRFQSLTLTAADSGATADGSSDFLLMGSGFYTTRTAANLGPLKVPAISFVLWVLAIGAVVAGFVLKPALAGPQLSGFGLIRLLALGFHILAFVVAFILWDFEIKAFLGTSLLALFTSGAFGKWQVLAVTTLFEVVPFWLGLFLFGMPIRFIVNSGLKLGGLKKARGIGKGIGDLAVWGLGAPFIPLLLNGIIQPLVDALGNALPH